ncbi:MAG: L,D-transpeptidase family protein [Chthoniobacteraceae bacterium]
MIRSKACLALFILTAVVFSGCRLGGGYRDDTLYIGGFRRAPHAQQKRAPHDDVSYWDGNGVAGSPSLRIDLGEQKAFFYKGGQLVGVSILSSGREGFNTPTGSFRIQQKDRHHASSLYGDYVDASSGEIVKKDIDRTKDRMPAGAKYVGASMPYFMRIHGGVGMHEGFLPGYPASHGCIRMPGFMAERFFENVSVGTPVTVTH